MRDCQECTLGDETGFVIIVTRPSLRLDFTSQRNNKNDDGEATANTNNSE